MEAKSVPQFVQAKRGWLARLPGVQLTGWGNTKEEAEQAVKRMAEGYYAALTRETKARNQG
jgi:hypothetical protein